MAPSEATTSIPPVPTTNAPESLPEVKLDIEHVPVDDDPRMWSNFRKNFVLFQVSVGTMIAGLASNIQNRESTSLMEADLNATSSQISLTIALFILLQGCMPLLWSVISEIKGRKVVYVSSLSIFFAASLVVARSTTIQLVIGFRCLQAAGHVSFRFCLASSSTSPSSSSAVMAIGAATLADIFEPEVRGTKMGIYYIAPLMGPSLGPILGGALTIGFGWRGPFYFLAATAGLVSLSFLFLYKDTFRRERSLVYQKALKHRLREEAHKEMESKRKSTSSDLDKRTEPDVEKQQGMHNKKDVLPNMKITWKDINPVQPLWRVLHRSNNFCVLLASGLIFAFCIVVPYTISRTLGTYYHYNALKIGLVLLSFGLGSMAGSILGGRWSDYQLAKLKTANGGKRYPEMRLRSTIHGSILFPVFTLGFAWVSDKHVHIAAPIVMLFMCGFAVTFVYTSTLAYLVDANVGQSSTAIALNSAFRGIGAFTITEIAVPMQAIILYLIFPGWMYTILAGLMAICGLLILTVSYKGRDWRSAADEQEKQSEVKS
ncbi:MFS general substrate transporter [Marasmius fiardii PR-910]|nr:MFS general substrate transporter [Marasmius fiardii PR-910]